MGSGGDIQTYRVGGWKRFVVLNAYPHFDTNTSAHNPFGQYVYLYGTRIVVHYRGIPLQWP